MNRIAYFASIAGASTVAALVSATAANLNVSTIGEDARPAANAAAKQARNVVVIKAYPVGEQRAAGDGGATRPIAQEAPLFAERTMDRAAAARVRSLGYSDYWRLAPRVEQSTSSATPVARPAADGARGAGGRDRKRTVIRRRLVEVEPIVRSQRQTNASAKRPDWRDKAWEVRN